jgi:hypothetical protein
VNREFYPSEIHSTSKDGRRVMVVMVREFVRTINGRRVVKKKSVTRHLHIEDNGAYSGVEMRFDKKQNQWVPVKHLWTCIAKEQEVAA